MDYQKPKEYQIPDLKNQIESFQNEKDQLLRRVNVINDAMEALRKSCTHTKDDGSDGWVYDGHDSHKDYYRCGICGKETSV